MLENGRGAFTKVGKDNELSFYEFKKGLPVDGKSPEKGFNYEAVHLGVKSIEGRLNQLGANLVEDGTYGPKVRKAVKAFQKSNGIAVTGLVGYTTGPALFKGAIAGAGEGYKFPTSLVWGVMKAESGGDPGAVGYSTPGDRGLFQFNTLVHDISYEQAHDFDWAIETMFACSYEEAHDFDWAIETMFARFNNAWHKYDGKGNDLRVKCSILQHKSPVYADEWFLSEQAPGPISENYVSKIKAFALTY